MSITEQLDDNVYHQLHSTLLARPTRREKQQGKQKTWDKQKILISSFHLQEWFNVGIQTGIASVMGKVLHLQGFNYQQGSSDHRNEQQPVPTTTSRQEKANTINADQYSDYNRANYNQRNIACFVT